MPARALRHVKPRNEKGGSIRFESINARKGIKTYPSNQAIRQH